MKTWKHCAVIGFSAILVIAVVFIVCKKAVHNIYQHNKK
jgi:hypothetical protein